MEGTATIAALSRLHPFLPLSSSPHKTNQSIHIPSIHSKISQYYCPKLTSICHAKLNEEVGDASERIKEAIFGNNGIIDDYESDDEEDNTESSIDLLFRFLQSMFKKVSKRARKASRSILPDVISPQLVSFAVDGVLLLASLSILKALLEVVCTLGGTVFVAILLLRLVWSAVSYFQPNGTASNQRNSSYGRTQPQA
ncbi:hypothetical protein M9H77_10068 [Catharanthus roseus]|uniref:Uncharacterized protein n=1 Tax=Catharanthus roseus TaxID=4058 RepID=A0ACC0C2A6_CATRO|nr:hypothetical protein M9H77_10068 [Catharanthus roseus]